MKYLVIYCILVIFVPHCVIACQCIIQKKIDMAIFLIYHRKSTIYDQYGKNMKSDRNNINNFEERRSRLAKLSKGLSHPLRVEIIRILENKPQDARCVCGDIVKVLPGNPYAGVLDIDNRLCSSTPLAAIAIQSG